jgi:hypothetical protein
MCFQVVSFPQVSPPKLCMHLSSPPYVLHVLPISVFLIWHELHRFHKTGSNLCTTNSRHASGLKASNDACPPSFELLKVTIQTENCFRLRMTKSKTPYLGRTLKADYWLENLFPSEKRRWFTYLPQSNKTKFLEICIIFGPQHGAKTVQNLRFP